MKNRTFVLIHLIFLSLWFSVGARAQAAPGDFSADVVSSSPQGTVNMKLYSTAGKSRMEMPGNIMIIRQDLQVMWMVMPSESMYMEQPIDPAMLVKTSRVVPGEIERTPMGNESIDGKTTQKFKITYETAGRRETLYQWIGTNDMPARVQAVDGSWTVDYKNVSTVHQPDSLFDPPAGYQKMAIPSMGDFNT